MAFVVGTFVLVLAIVVGPYWLFVEHPEVQDEMAVRRRVRKGSVASQLTKALTKDRERLSDVGFLDAALSRFGQIVRPMQLTIAQSGLKVTVGVVMLSGLLAAAVMF